MQSVNKTSQIPLKPKLFRLSAEQNGKYVYYKIGDARVSIILEHAEALLSEVTLISPTALAIRGS